MALQDHVKLSITADTLRLIGQGYGIPMILSHTASGVFNPGERVRYYSSTSSVAEDFADGTIEYLAAEALFVENPGNPPSPELIAIGSSTVNVTQKFTISISSVTANRVYSIRVRDADSVNSLVSYTAGGSPTNDSIVAGLVGVLNGVASKNYTASAVGTPGTEDVEVVGDNPNDWFSLEIQDITALSIIQDHADPGMAAELTSMVLVDSDWYTIHTLYNSAAYVGAVAAWVETNKKLYVFCSNDTEIVTTPDPGSDILSLIKIADYARTMGDYHPSLYDQLASTWMGRILPQLPGSTTWKFKRLTGPSPVSLTNTQRLNLRNKNGNSYERVANVNITFEGTSASGEFLDVVRGIDWLENDMSIAVFGVLVQNEKLGFIDQDIAVIEEAVRASLARGLTNGFLAEVLSVQVPMALDTDPVDRAARVLKTIRWSARIQGAIHTVEIEGTLTV